MEYLEAKQVHGNTILKVDRNYPKWPKADGLYTSDKNMGLVVHGADCAIMSFWNNELIGVCHAGWRGLISGIIDDMVKIFGPNTTCFLGPFMHKMEIKKDYCYEQIEKVFGKKYFKETNNIIYFDFQQAVLDKLTTIKVDYDNRSTLEDNLLASYRRGDRLGNKKGFGSQNFIVIQRDKNGSVESKFCYPGDREMLIKIKQEQKPFIQ